jgi:Mn2+/Fe2+ NRAMP family transporter
MIEIHKQSIIQIYTLTIFTGSINCIILAFRSSLYLRREALVSALVFALFVPILLRSMARRTPSASCSRNRRSARVSYLMRQY